MVGDDGEEARRLAQARAGSARAFAVLLERHQQGVRGFLRRLCGDHALADDLAQDAFATAWMRLGAFEGRSSFRSWVCGIGYRRFLDVRRADRRRSARDAAWVQEQEAVTIPGESDVGVLRRALDALPPDQRAAVALCLAGGWTHAEAAEALALPLGTIKSHVQRGRARLRAAAGLTDEGRTDEGPTDEARTDE